MDKIILKLNCFKPEVILGTDGKVEYSSVTAAIKALDKLGASYSIVY